MSLQGNLLDLPLIDLVQVLTLQNKTGILSLSQDFSQAQVAFCKSRIYSVFVSHNTPNGVVAYKRGEEALYDLIDWTEGQFTFELTTILPAEQNVQCKWDYIILEHYRRQDEKEQKQQISKMLTACPCLVPTPSFQAEINLELDQWRVLFQINGILSVKEIAQNIQQKPEEVACIIDMLMKKGLVELKLDPTTVPAPSYQPLQQTTSRRDSQVNQAKPLSAPSKPFYSLNSSSSTTRTLETFTPLAQTGPSQAVRHNSQVADAGEVSEKPKVQRGVLANLMARIRGL
jgi:hypothetical protein